MKLTLALVIAAVALVAAACGGGDGGGNGTAAGAAGAKAIEIEMKDIAYEPKTIEVGEGEQVTFRFANKGRVQHEGYVGTPDEQAAHEKEMKETGDAGKGHAAHGGGDDDRKVTVAPGHTGELTYTFDEAGTYEIGCHEPGHYDAGMKVTVDVS